MSDDETPSRPAWAKWVTYGTLAVAAAALVWTVYSVGLSSILVRLGGIGYWFIAVVAIEAGVTLCDAGALYMFLRPDSDKLGYPRVVMAQVSARAVNAVTPLGSLGEVVKTTMLLERVSESRAVSAVLLYNIAGVELSLILIALGAPLTGLLVAMPMSLRTLLLVSGLVSAGLAVAIPLLVMRGVLASLVGAGRALRIVSKKRAAKWRGKLEAIDEKLRDVKGARRHDRTMAIAIMILSRFGTWGSTALLIHAAGGGLSVGFLAAVLTGGQVLTWLSTLVPMGLGISEGGNYALFRALGHEPGIGVTVALGKRVTTIIYAAIGLVLVSVNQTVKEAKAAHDRRKGKTQRAPRSVPPRSLPPGVEPDPALPRK